jgi:hypothetical protein
MQSTAARIGMLIAVVAAAVVLFVVLSGGDDDNGDDATVATIGTATGTTSVPEPPEAINVRDGEVVGGVRTLTYSRGEEVKLLVYLDRPEEEIHVHGYEITKPAPARGSVRLSFRADIDGLFEVELHRADGTEAQIAELRVNP